MFALSANVTCSALAGEIFFIIIIIQCMQLFLRKKYRHLQEDQSSDILE